jgi:hypothetical protein
MTYFKRTIMKNSHIYFMLSEKNNVLHNMTSFQGKLQRGIWPKVTQSTSSLHCKEWIFSKQFVSEMKLNEVYAPSLLFLPHLPKFFLLFKMQLIPNQS